MTFARSTVTSSSQRKTLLTQFQLETTIPEEKTILELQIWKYKPGLSLELQQYILCYKQNQIRIKLRI